MEFITKSKITFNESHFESEEPSINRKKLPSYSEINLENFAGPLRESNKVFERFYAGAFPGDNDNGLNDYNLTTLLNFGINAFVCMQLEYNDAAPENDWRIWDLSKRPYFKDVERILANRDKYPLLGTGVTDDVTFHHFPIEDLSTISDAETLIAAKEVVNLLEQGKTVYLHCWGGHGRTGIIVCLVLHLMFNLSAKEALEYCDLVHRMRRIQVDVRSPQTEKQRQQVARIINRNLYDATVNYTDRKEK